MVDESVFIHHYGSKTFLANNIDYRGSLSVNGSHFKEKWPDADYDELLELHTSLVDLNASMLIKGQEALDAGHPADALAVYAKVLTANPIDDGALYGTGLAFQMSGKTVEAIAAFKKALKVNPTLTHAYGRLALAYESMNQTDDAISVLQKATEFNNHDAAVYNNLGVLYFKKKNHASARNCFERALSIDVNYQEAQQNLKKVSWSSEKITNHTFAHIS
jgi:tetratricopeptide (TPR) repeat protein